MKPKLILFITRPFAPFNILRDTDNRIRNATKMICCTITVLVLSIGFAFAEPEVELVRELKPLSVRGVNYYPRETPWGGMWTKTPDGVWARDMQLVASLGANAIRTFVQFGPKIEKAGLMNRDGSLTPAYLAKIETLLAAASTNKIRVIFCFEFDLEMLAAKNTAELWQRTLTDLVTLHRDDGRVLMWDLMNEPDDDTKWTEATRAYLKAAIPFVKQLDPNHRTTVGMAYRTDRLAEVGLPDVLQYHEYTPKALLIERGLGRVSDVIASQRRVGSPRELLIGEFGMCTARDPQFGADPALSVKLADHPGTEDEQVRIYKTILEAAEKGQVAGVIPWCLFDYPIHNPNESHFGLVRSDGSLKPAAIVLREAFARWSKP